MSFRCFVGLALGLGILLFCAPEANAQGAADVSTVQTINPLIGPSFPCPQPTDSLAQLVCSTPQLALLDMQFVQAYEALYQQAGTSGQAGIRHLDIQFDLYVRKTCNIAPSEAAGSSSTLPPAAPPGAANCAIMLYQQQIGVWKTMLQGPALEEATRPIQDQVNLQSQLQALRFLPKTATPDGVFGTGTRAAIIAWQQSVSRQPTGLLGNDDAVALLAQASALQSSGAPEPSAPSFPAATQQTTAAVPTVAPGGAGIIPLDLQGVWAADCVGAGNNSAPYMVLGPSQVLIAASGGNSTVAEAVDYLASRSDFAFGYDASFNPSGSQSAPTITVDVFAKVSENQISLIGTFSATTGVVPAGPVILNKCAEILPFSSSTQQVSSFVQPAPNELSAATTVLSEMPIVAGVDWSAVSSP